MAPSTSTAERFSQGGVEVLSVTDGDTMRVLVDGINEPLRLIGINAPEQGECLSAQATERLAELVGDGGVQVESDTSDRDQYDRLLRYVFVGDSFVNAVLVREGLAVSRAYEPDTARQGTLDAAQAAAQEEGVGMWDPTACGAGSTSGLEVGDIHPDADGDDNHNLNEEWVEVVNRGDDTIDLTGWSIKDESASHRYPFPDGFTLGPDSSVRLHTGCGQDTPERLYWCKTGSAVWNNSGDTIFVVDPAGNTVDFRTYSG